MDEWIEWNGGECPVFPHTKVRVKFHPMWSEPEPYESTDIKDAGDLWWDHRKCGDEPSAGNIIAYRIVP